MEEMGKDKTEEWTKNISDKRLRPSSLPAKVATPTPHDLENNKDTEDWNTKNSDTHIKFAYLCVCLSILILTRLYSKKVKRQQYFYCPGNVNQYKTSKKRRNFTSSNVNTDLSLTRN